MRSFSPKAILLICIVLFARTPGHSQKITHSEIGYLYNISNDSLLNDSIIQASVKSLFSKDGAEVAGVLYNPTDTAFYATLRTILILDNSMESFYEINLSGIEKTGNGYTLKCVFLYSISEDKMTTIVGIVHLPFIVKDKKIFFKNYFAENAGHGFTQGKIPNIYTTSDNINRLKSISEYINSIATKYGLEIDSSKKLFYVYYRGNKNAFSALGIDECAIPNSMRLPLGHDEGIFDQTGSGFYKHEIVHYVSEKKHLSKFFSEGFASYLGGSTAKHDSTYDYTELLSFLQTHNTDSTINKIVSRGMPPFGFEYYSFASFTIRLMIGKYGDGFLNEKKLQKIVHSTSPQEIIAFISKELNTSGKPLTDFYIESLKSYLGKLEEKK